MVGSRTAHHARSAGRRHPQQSGARRTAPRIAGRLRVGRSRMAKSCFIPMRPSPARSAPSSNVSPNSARHAGSGSGFAPKVCPSRCRRARMPDRSAGSPHLHAAPSCPHQSGVCWRLCLRQDPSANATSMNRAPSRNACGICPWPNGRCSSPIIIPASSIGRPSRPIRRGSIPTLSPRPHQAGGAVREGSALLQGIATCGHCGRRLHVHYRGRNSAPGYHCAGKDLVNGRGVYCLNVGGMADRASRGRCFSRGRHAGGRRSDPTRRSNNCNPTTMRPCRNGVWK